MKLTEIKTENVSYVGEEPDTITTSQLNYPNSMSNNINVGPPVEITNYVFQTQDGERIPFRRSEVPKDEIKKNDVLILERKYLCLGRLKGLISKKLKLKI
jgi:hypothetical protein